MSLNWNEEKKMIKNIKKINEGLIYKALLVSGIAFSLILTGCSGKSHQVTEEASSTISAQVSVIEEIDHPVTESAVGTVVAKTQAQVASKVMGTLTGVYVKEGQLVKAGQILAKVDASDLQPNVEKAGAGLQEIKSAMSELDKVQKEIDAGIQAAQANYDFASTSLNRYGNLYKREAISKEMYDETFRQYKMAESNLQSAFAKKEGLGDKRLQLKAKQSQVQADMKLARTYVGFSSIVSPISGWVVKKYMDQGSMAVPGQPLMVIESRDYEFESSVKESLLPQIKAGNTVQVSLDAVTGPIESKIVEIVPSADPMNRSFTIKGSLPAVEGIRSGMYGKMEISAGLRKMVLIPSASVIQRNSLEGVFSLDSADRAFYRVVKTGKLYGDKIEIISGLQAGDRVVVSNQDKIKEGMKVEVAQ